MKSFEYNLWHGIKNAGKRLRTVRLYLSPRAVATRRRLLDERSIPRGQAWDSGPWVVVDLHTTLPDGQQGRRSYALITYFLQAGYRIAIVANHGFVGNIDRRLKGLLLEHPFVVIPHLEAFAGVDAVLITDRAHEKPPHRFHRQIVVKTSGFFEPSRGEIAFPFTLFPRVLHLGMDHEFGRLRGLHRRWRLFFGGDYLYRDYNTHWIRREFGKVPRRQALEIIRDELPGDRTVRPSSKAEIESLLERDVPGFVWFPEPTGATHPAEWLEVLAHAAVFAAVPGVSYPVSHNIVEAMAVGTVPLTEYPEQFDPPLRHGEDCIVYAGADGLRSRVAEVVSMSPETLAEMGRAAAGYYDRHIAPEAFIRSLEADPRPTVVLHLKGYERPPVA